MPEFRPTSDGTLTYEQWLDYCFDRGSDGWTSEQFEDIRDEYGVPVWKDWYRPSAARLCADLTRLFRGARALVGRYTPEQLDRGFWYVLGIGSGYLGVRLDTTVSEAARIELVESIFDLYEQLFAPLCGDAIEEGEPSHPVSSACFMMWDMDCLWPPREPEFASIKEAQYRVLERSLSIGSDAVRQSALHGLGDTHYLADPERVRCIIDRFLAAHTELRPELLQYALDAREGHVM